MSLLFSFVACSKEKIETQNKPADNGFVTASENRKYHLTCLFHGEEADTGAGDTIKVVRYLTLRSDTTGKEVRYVPPDEVSLVSSRGYFTNVWSPDEEYLILPLGRFKGYCIIKSGSALEVVEKQQCSDFVRLESTNGTGLWHDFEKWTSTDAFLFKAGLSGDDFTFEYNIREQKLTALSPGARSFVGENSRGKL